MEKAAHRACKASNRDVKGIVRRNKAKIGNRNEYFASVSLQRSLSRLPSSFFEGESFLATILWFPWSCHRVCGQRNAAEFQKALGVVPYQRLQEKLSCYEIKGKVFTSINDRNLAAVVFLKYLLENQPNLV